VEPPLEFRHLQSARLFAWRGATDDPDVQQLVSAVRRVVERSAAPMPSPVGRRAEVGTAKSWWETPAGWAAGAAALLLAAALLVLVLRTAGLIGGATPAPHELAVQSNSSGEPVPAAASGGASRPTNPPAGTINLLDGAKILAANEAGWKDYIYARDAPYCSVISTNGFVTFAFRDERRARFNKLGVFVEATSSYNVKTVELYASDESERGPFQKVGTFVVPNFRNERQPFHEFAFETVTARYVKLVAVDWQERAGGPNGNVCTMQLLGILQ
jgi:hypothetical protein